MLNALNAALHEDLFRCIAEARNDDAVRVIVITGAGRGFCSGADLTGRTPSDPSGASLHPDPGQNERLDELQWFGRQAVAMFSVDKPTIAAVNGVAVGAGMSLAMRCDLRVGSENSRFRTIFLERGISPDSGLSYVLPRIVGFARAMDLILTSREVQGRQAFEMGLLNRFVEPDRLIDASLELAEQIAAWPPLAVRTAKRVTQQNLARRFEDALRNEARHIEINRQALQDAP